MRWPFVSRTAFDAVTNEAVWLRAQLADRMEQLTRIARKEAGMSEVPVERHPAPESIPVNTMEKIMAWRSDHVREAMERRVRGWRREGMDWASIDAILDKQQDGAR